MESLEEVRVILLGKTVVETSVPTWRPVLAVAEVKEVTSKILEGTAVDALVQPILSVGLEEGVAASED